MSITKVLTDYYYPLHCNAGVIRDCQQCSDVTGQMGPTHDDLYTASR